MERWLGHLRETIEFRVQKLHLVGPSRVTPGTSSAAMDGVHRHGMLRQVLLGLVSRPR